MRSAFFAACVFLALCVIARADDAPPVFYLAAPESFASEIPCTALVRELARQSLLIVARDEFGLYTRDGILREWAPDAKGNPPVDALGKPSLLMNVRSTPNPGETCIWLYVNVPGRPCVLNVLLKPPTPEKSRTPVSIPRMLEKIEPTGQNVFFDQLKKLGYTPNKRPRCDEEVPPEIDHLLYQTTFFSAYSAIQQVHAAIRESGESPARLSALVRGYANLGELTRFQWSSIQKVMTARSLLYAQQMVREDPDSAFSYYNRAYALALTGLYAPALEDLGRAGKIREQHADDDKPLPKIPRWAQLLEPYCKYDLDALVAMGPKSDVRAPLVALLVFTDVENCGSLSEILGLGNATLEVDGRCFRILDGMMVHAGVISGQELSERAPRVMLDTLPDEIKLLTTIPKTTEKALREAQGNDDHVANLTAVCKSFVKATEPAEPSFALAGRLLQETNFIHIMRSASFSIDQCHSSCSTYIDSMAPLISDHPHRDFVDSLKVEDVFRGPQLTSLEVNDPQWQMFKLLATLATQKSTPGHMNGNAGWLRIHQFPDQTAHDLEPALSPPAYEDVENEKLLAPQLLRLSPYSGLAAATIVRTDYASAEPHIAEWTERFADQPVFLGSLADHWVRAGKPELAEPLLKKVIAVAPDLFYIEMLARIYLNRGDEDDWLSTMKLVLKAPDYRQDHSYAEAEIAWHYMHTGQFDTARSYADASYNDSGSYWAMACDAWAMEFQGDFGSAENMRMQTSERYDPTALLYWCKRTGKGNLAEAERLAAPWLARVVKKREFIEFARAGDLLLLEGRSAEAKKIYDISMRQTHNAFAGLGLAMICANEKDVDGRDTALKFTAENCTITTDKADLKTLADYAKLVLDCGDRAPSGEEVDHLLDTGHANATGKCALYYYRGRQLQAAGDIDQAKKSYQIAIQTSAITSSCYALACDKLHKLGEITPLTKPEDGMLSGIPLN